MATKKDHALAAFMLVQQLNAEYWEYATEPQKPDEMHWDINDAGHIYKARYEIYTELRKALQAARGGDVAPLVPWVASRLAGRGVLEVHGILHAKDMLTTWDASKNEYVQTPKAPHVHIMVRFKPQKSFDTSRTLANVAAALGVEPQAIERPGRGRFAVDNMIAYLTHIKYVDKHQYAPEEVVSLVPEGSDGKTYATIYAERRLDWMRGRGEVSKKNAAINIEALINDITDGKISKQQILLTDELLMIYSRYRRRINDAFATNLERKVLNTVNDMKSGKFRLSVFFVTGEAGQGKSLFADFFASALQKYERETKGEDWQVYDAAATNGMDDYNGEEILVLDDLRAGAMRSEDWLRLLDNHRTKAASARFYNKTPICKTLIITSIKEPFEFFAALARSDSEDLNQFIRRISACVKVINVSEGLRNARFTIGEVKKVEPFRLGYDGKPLVYSFEDDSCEYDSLKAVQRLLGMVEKSTAPALSPFPEGWETEILKPYQEPPFSPL